MLNNRDYRRKKEKHPSKSGRGQLFKTINCEQDNKIEIKKPKNHTGNGPVSLFSV